MATIDTAARRSRRALLTSVLGAVAATAATAIAGAQRVLAAGDDGAIIHVGDFLTDVQSTTTLANNANNFAVMQLTSNGTGDALRTRADSGVGVKAFSDGTAIQGTSTAGAGVHGESGSHVGVEGVANTGIGVRGTANGAGWTSVVALKESPGTALAALIVDPGSGSSAVEASTQGGGAGIFAESSKGRGGRFRGNKAQIRLDPSASPNHPRSGAAGDLFVDASKRLWFCRGGTSWVRLA
jgi:hypothetical protein